METRKDMAAPNRLRKRPKRKNGAKAFTNEEINALERETKPYYVTDRDGFAVRVLPSGEKTFYFKYTYGGKKRQINLGMYIEEKKAGNDSGKKATLKEAREKHRELLTIYEAKGDPGAQLGENLESEAEPKKNYLTMTIKEIADDYIEFMSDPVNRAKTTCAEATRTINTYIIPYFKNCHLDKAADVKRQDATGLIKHVAKNERPDGERTLGQARAVLKIARAMFNYRIEKDDLGCEVVNPFSGLGKKKDVEPVMKNRRQGVALEEEEIITVWRKLNAASGPGSASVSRALMLTLVTGQRPGEVSGMHRKEIRGDWWQIPARRIKTRDKRYQDHRVYLTPLAKKIIGDFTGYIFPTPAPGHEGKPISEKALAALVNEETVAGKGGARVVTRPKWFGLSQKWTPNDLRRTARTRLTGLGCPKDVGEAILNHMKEEIHGKYDLYTYDREKRQWLMEWSTELERLLEGDAESIRIVDAAYDVQELETLVAQMPLTEVAKRLEISDNAVRKRCKKHGIQLKPQGFWLKGRARGW